MEVKQQRRDVRGLTKSPMVNGQYHGNLADKAMDFNKLWGTDQS